MDSTASDNTDGDSRVLNPYAPIEYKSSVCETCHSTRFWIFALWTAVLLESPFIYLVSWQRLLKEGVSLANWWPTLLVFVFGMLIGSAPSTTEHLVKWMEKDGNRVN